MLLRGIPPPDWQRVLRGQTIPLSTNGDIRAALYSHKDSYAFSENFRNLWTKMMNGTLLTQHWKKDQDCRARRSDVPVAVVREAMPSCPNWMWIDWSWILTSARISESCDSHWAGRSRRILGLEDWTCRSRVAWILAFFLSFYHRM